MPAEVQLSIVDNDLVGIPTYNLLTAPVAGAASGLAFVSDAGTNGSLRYYTDNRIIQASPFKLLEFTGKLLVPALAAANAATYSQTGNTITVNSTGHNIPATTFNGATVYLAIGTVSTGVAPTAQYANWFTNFQYVDANSFTCQATNSQTGTGVVNTNTSATTFTPLTKAFAANFFSVGDNFSVLGFFANNNSAGTKVIATALGGGQIQNSPTGTTVTGNIITVFNAGTFVSPTQMYRAGNPASPTTVDLTASLTLTVNVTLNTANDYCCLLSHIVTLNRAG